MARKEITVKLFIGEKQVDRLPEDYCDRMMDRLSETMSRYYTEHPDEYAILLAGLRKEGKIVAD